MRKLITLLALLASSMLYAQNPVALRTSDPKFAPRWENVPAPTTALALRNRSVGWAATYRPVGPVEIAYCLVDEAWKISPVSAITTINPAISGWDCVATTPGVPLWTRATGILWVYRQAGTATWKVFAADQNRNNPGTTVKPFKAITGWDHAFGGHWIYPSNFPDLSHTDLYPPSTVLTASPPAPSVRVLECPNQGYDIAWAWACNQGETALSPILYVPPIAGLSASHHAPISLIRVLGSNVGQPPQGALGKYLYMRKAGGPWHRQPCPDGHTGNLWALDAVMVYCNQFVETGIQPGPTTGKSYLSSLHLALRDWNRDIIIDDDQTICCPLISEWNGASWDYQPVNHWIAAFAMSQNIGGTWTLTVDGITTPPMPNLHNYPNLPGYGGGWAVWTPTLDATFGAGNIKIGHHWENSSPKIELVGKYAAADWTGKVAIEVKNAAGTVIDPIITGTQKGQGWVLSNGGQTKFKRKISTSNAGNWKVQDTATAPDGITGYPMGWPLWVEFSQRTKLVGCDFLLIQSNCGIATCDNNGGGCFHFNPVECSVAPHFTNTRPVTFGFRCVDSSGWGYGGHLCSELVMEKCHLQGKFPLVCEGQQAANWQIRDGNFYSDGTFDSAIITQRNAGAITFGGRFTCDNARALVASVWCNKTTFENLWIDGGIPTLTNYNAQSWSKTTINGGKINQWVPAYERSIDALVMHGYNREQLETLDWEALFPIALAELGYIHAIESPAGELSAGNVIQKLVTDNLDSQDNGPVESSLCNPKAGQAVYAPRVPAETPGLLLSIRRVTKQPRP